MNEEFEFISAEYEYYSDTIPIIVAVKKQDRSKFFQINIEYDPCDDHDDVLQDFEVDEVYNNGELDYNSYGTSFTLMNI
jgi:hypothetical protein